MEYLRSVLGHRRSHVIHTVGPEDPDSSAPWASSFPEHSESLGEPLSDDREGTIAKPDEDDVDDTTALLNSSPLHADDPSHAGIAKIEAVSLVSSRRSLYAIFLGIFLMYAAKSLAQESTTPLAAYVTSAFKFHSLLPIVSIVSSVVGAVCAVPISKLIDVYGRAEGFIAMVILQMLGFIMVAASQSVHTYFASSFFQAIGNRGMDYVGSVIVSDMTTLATRTIFLGLTSMPYIVTVWIGPAVAQAVLSGPGWRWGYGIWSLAVPIACTPFLVLLVINQRKAKAAGLVQEAPVSGRWGRQVKWWFWELDVFGMLLLVGGVGLILVTISIAKRSGAKENSRQAPEIIIAGVILLLIFMAYERWWSHKPLVPFYLIKDRTILGASMMGAFRWATFYIWGANYWESYLQVVFQLSVRNAGYVGNIFSIVSCLWAPILGVIIQRYGRFKRLALIAVPLQVAGLALMGLLRHHEIPISLLCVPQVLLALGGGSLVNTEEIAAMAATTHEGIAIVLAFKALFAYLGGATGSAISAAIWTSLMPIYLEQHLPESHRDQAEEIFGSLKTQLSYEWGSDVRMGIVQAYEDVWRVSTRIATIVAAVSIFWVLIWKDINLKDRKQGPGQQL